MEIKYVRGVLATLELKFTDSLDRCGPRLSADSTAWAAGSYKAQYLFLCISSSLFLLQILSEQATPLSRKSSFSVLTTIYAYDSAATRRALHISNPVRVSLSLLTSYVVNKRKIHVRLIK